MPRYSTILLELTSGGATVTFTYGSGAAFELSAGNWTYYALDMFIPNPPLGWDPCSTLLLTSGGELVGTTSYGGNSKCQCGVIYAIP
jgi:hypothetical protein